MSSVAMHDGMCCVGYKWMSKLAKLMGSRLIES